MATHFEPATQTQWPNALLLGGVTALGAGFVWGGLEVISGYRLAWLAPLLGVVMGLVLREFIRVPPRRAGTLALVLTFAALLLGRATVSQLGAHYVSTREVRDDPYLVYGALEARMRAQRSFPAPLQARLDRLVAAAPGPPGDGEGGEVVLLGQDLYLAVRQRMADMDDAQKRDVVQWWLNEAPGVVPRAARRRLLLALSDALWWGAALALAYWLSQKREHDAPLPHEEIELGEEELGKEAVAVSAPHPLPREG